MFKDRLIRANGFYANPEKVDRLRVNRFVQVRPPQNMDADQTSVEADDVYRKLSGPEPINLAAAPPTPNETIAAMAEFLGSINTGPTEAACATAAYLLQRGVERPSPAAQAVDAGQRGPEETAPQAPQPVIAEDEDDPIDAVIATVGLQARPARHARRTPLVPPATAVEGAGPAAGAVEARKPREGTRLPDGPKDTAPAPPPADYGLSFLDGLMEEDDGEDGQGDEAPTVVPEAAAGAGNAEAPKEPAVADADAGKDDPINAQMAAPGEPDASSPGTAVAGSVAAGAGAAEAPQASREPGEGAVATEIDGGVFLPGGSPEKTPPGDAGLAGQDDGDYTTALLKDILRAGATAQVAQESAMRQKRQTPAPVDN